MDPCSPDYLPPPFTSNSTPVRSSSCPPIPVRSLPTTTLAEAIQAQTPTCSSMEFPNQSLWISELSTQPVIGTSFCIHRRCLSDLNSQPPSAPRICSLFHRPFYEFRIGLDSGPLRLSGLKFGATSALVIDWEWMSGLSPPLVANWIGFRVFQVRVRFVVVMGPRIPNRVIYNFIKNSWKVRTPKLFIKNNGIMIFKFLSDEDLRWVLEHGSWSIGSSPFLLKQWVPGEAMDWSFFKTAPV